MIKPVSQVLLSSSFEIIIFVFQILFVLCRIGHHYPIGLFVFTPDNRLFSFPLFICDLFKNLCPIIKLSCAFLSTISFGWFCPFFSIGRQILIPSLNCAKDHCFIFRALYSC